MSFNSLKKDELAKVAEFFVVDVEAADPEKGPSKKELLAALAAGDDPVTWDQYKEVYLEANPEVEEKQTPLAPSVPVANPAPQEDSVPIRYIGNNGTLEVVGYTFTQAHPFASVPAPVAEYLVLKVEGFRMALPSEVADYYG